MTVPSSQVAESIDHLFRHRAGQLISTLSRVFGLENLELIEDAVQDAIVAALRRWPFHGVPEHPYAWTLTVARNAILDQLRRRGSWRARESAVLAELSSAAVLSADWDVAFSRELRDDQLRMIFACCHQAILRDDGVALTLKVVSGFSVAEIARAFLTNRPTMAQRLVRAKKKLRSGEIALTIPEPIAVGSRLGSVLEVLYLMFNEGYATGQGDDVVRRDLCEEALRLCRLLCEHPATAGPGTHALAALFAFQSSRLATREDVAGDLLLLSEQDRTLWDRRLISEGLRYLRESARGDEVTDYHLQAEIAGCHALAPNYAETDWQRVLDCYDQLLRHNPSPVVALNRLVALSRIEDPELALSEMAELAAHPALASYYPRFAIHANLLSKVGRHREAADCYEFAIELAESIPVRRFLEGRRAEAARLGLRQAGRPFRKQALHPASS